MKFADSFKEKQNPAWKAYYLNYAELRDLLYDGIAKAPKITNAADTGRYDYAQYVNRFDQAFFKMCKHQLEKINKFYKEKSREYNYKFTEIKQDAELSQAAVADQESQQAAIGKQNFFKTFAKNKTRSGVSEEVVKQSLTDLYLEIVALTKYQELIYVAFRKILKKHDKLFGGDAGAKMLRDVVETSRFHTNKQAYKLLEEIETIMTTVFEKGSRARAMKILRVPHRDDKLGAWTAFKLGIMMGTAIVLFAVLAFSGQIQDNRWRVIVRFFRGPIVLDLYICLIGVNFYFWKQRGINHVYIFGLNPRDNLAHHHLWNISAVLGVTWAISLVLFLNSANVHIPAYASPFALLCIQIIILFNPLPFVYWSSRKWLLKIILRIFTAPFHRVSFADFWMADQLSSLASLTLDYQFMICFFSNMPASLEVTQVFDGRVCFSSEFAKCQCDSRKNLYRPILRALPALLRLVQCLRRYYDNHLVCPHLVNAGKYSMSLTATIFSALHSIQPFGLDKHDMFYVWISGSITSSLYSYVWDIRMDWGLGDRKAKHPFLRTDLLYSSYWFYYVAVFADFILRFVWAISLSLTEMGYVDPDIMLTITTPAEIFRRFMWNLFRLEHEQINNNNAQRLNRLQMIGSDASIIATEEQRMKELLKMMDADDGVPKHRVSVDASSSRLSISVSAKTVVERSKTELFTRVSSQQDNKTEGSEASSNENAPPESFITKLKNIFCCFKKSKNN